MNRRGVYGISQSWTGNARWIGGRNTVAVLMYVCIGTTFWNEGPTRMVEEYSAPSSGMAGSQSNYGTVTSWILR